MRPQERARQLRTYIEQAAISLSDEDALKAIELFPEWETDQEYKKDLRLTYKNRLWKVIQTHVSQSDWAPDVAPSLFAEVEKPGQGDSPDNPIVYNNNMELYKGKYYTQNNIIYYCIRDTGTPVYNNLADLVGLYVEEYTK